jgi:hypothetical protein
MVGIVLPLMQFRYDQPSYLLKRWQNFPGVETGENPIREKILPA